jgi:hydroxymethylglutaryl-CoA reductase
MAKHTILKGFSKLSDQEKRHVATAILDDPDKGINTLTSFCHPDPAIQKILSEFSENTLSNYPLPFGVAPNFMINDCMYMLPLVIEESSVVAAAASAAGFWATRGGFRAVVKGTEKTGQLHFLYTGDPKKLVQAGSDIIQFLTTKTRPLTHNMEKRGGGIRSIKLLDKQLLMDHYYQLHLAFDTVDAMGANFINSILEECSIGLHEYFENTSGFDAGLYEPLMAILSNYTPNCLVQVGVQCPVADLGEISGMSAEIFARRFVMAVQVAEKDVSRATTHNKGIMNGVDAVVLATGNDFRAVEAGAHAFAARTGQYRSLSTATIQDGVFHLSLEIPLALGTLGGLTRLHPLADISLQMLGNPSAKELMMIAASAGLANNFAAVRSLVTTGIQAGHMRMHLPNILRSLNCTPEENQLALIHFTDKKISQQAVTDYVAGLRKEKGGTL